MSPASHITGPQQSVPCSAVGKHVPSRQRYFAGSRAQLQTTPPFRLQRRRAFLLMAAASSGSTEKRRTRKRGHEDSGGLAPGEARAQRLFDALARCVGSQVAAELAAGARRATRAARTVAAGVGGRPTPVHALAVAAPEARPRFKQSSQLRPHRFTSVFGSVRTECGSELALTVLAAHVQKPVDPLHTLSPGQGSGEHVLPPPLQTLLTQVWSVPHGWLQPPQCWLLLVVLVSQLPSPLQSAVPVGQLTTHCPGATHFSCEAQYVVPVAHGQTLPLLPLAAAGAALALLSGTAWRPAAGSGWRRPRHWRAPHRSRAGAASSGDPSGCAALALSRRLPAAARDGTDPGSALAKQGAEQGAQGGPTGGSAWSARGIGHQSGQRP